jgi:hypothetical protein
MPTHLAGPLDVEIGTLSCTPAVADIRTRGGSISVASFDGLAKLTTTSRRPGAHVTVHGQDNLALLWLDAVHASVNLTLSPELAKKVWCYTLPAVDLPGMVRKVEGRGRVLLVRAAFEEAIASSQTITEDSSEDDLPSSRFKLSHGLPAMLIETEGAIAFSVESWIQSLSRRKSMHN